MIVYYIEYLRGKKQDWGRREIARKFVGTVTFYDESKSRAMKLGTGTNGFRPVMILKGVVFDNATQPPTLIRADYSFSKLQTYGAELPLTYIDPLGNIVRTEDLMVLMSPDSP